MNASVSALAKRSSRVTSDYSLDVRQAVVSHLKGDAVLTSLVSAKSIYGEQPGAQPKWPFIRYGFPITTSYEATCWSGSSHRVTIHAFARGPYTDAVLKIAAAVVDSMQRDIPSGLLDITDCQWSGTNVIRDTDEADAYHAVIDFDLTIVSS